MKSLYMECATGISGDMIVAALLDLGADREKLMKVLAGIPSNAFEVKISRVRKAGIDCCDFNVILDKEHDGHDHDMAYLYGHTQSDEIHSAPVEGEEEHGHHHSHDGEENGEHGHHDHDGEEHGHHHDHDSEEKESGHHHHHHHEDGNEENESGHHHHHHHEDGDEENESGHHHHHEKEHDKHHDHKHDHKHDHHHDHDHHHHHTGMKEIREIIGALEMTEGARELALKIFGILAEAEAKAHGTSIEEVHFHEVGAIDSVVDIVAAAVCFDDLCITECVFPFIIEGSGTVRCQHGILPVPVPAVANIAQAHGLPLQITSRKGELVTPTGAAFAAAVMTGCELPARYRISRIGLGAGKREYEVPSILRAMMLEVEDGGEEPAVLSGAFAAGAAAKESADDEGAAARGNTAVEGAMAEESAADGENADIIWRLECDMDDCTGEQLGYALERLFEGGAREAHYTPVFMKKNRPGWELTVICDAEHIAVMEKILFEETTTIGIRRQRMERTILNRRTEEAETPFGRIQIKVSSGGQAGSERIHPEYESVCAAARRCGVPFEKVYEAAMVAYAGQCAKE